MLEIKDLNNYSLLADFYEFTMGNGYFKSGQTDKIVYFDLFFRNIPDDGGFAIVAGLEQAVEYISNLKFSSEDIDFLRGKGIFDEGFLEYLENFKFTCDVWAIPEGTPIFPGEPIMVVRGPIIQTQLMETMLLVTMNYQSLIATKSNRIVRAARGRAVIEFGSRRAQGYSGAILGARAAYIGGCMGTANTMSDRLYGVPAMGTMAHSWVQSFDSELEAFRTYAKTYPDNCSLLIDTYDIMKEGLPNAIKVFKEELVPNGFRPKSVRIDSGDISYLSKAIRKVLDEEGFSDCGIMASNSLDEYVIESLLEQGAEIDSFGVGERLITSKSDPVFGGVYKLSAVEDEGKIIPKIKISENVEKITIPGFKQVHRFFDRDTHAPIADVISLHDEDFSDEEEIEIFHPVHTWKRKTINNFYTRKLLVPIFSGGELVYESPSISEIREFANSEIENLWDELKRFDNPHEYFVDLSQSLWDIQNELLNRH